MDCTALTHAQTSSRTVYHLSPDTAVYEKVPDPVIGHGKPPDGGIFGQMAKCRVWPCDRFLPGNTGFSHPAMVDLACEVASKERRI